MKIWGVFYEKRHPDIRRRLNCMFAVDSRLVVM